MSATPILTSLLDATLPDYAALVAENARLREELSTANHRERERAEEEVGQLLRALRTANATIARLRDESAQLQEQIADNAAMLREALAQSAELRTEQDRLRRNLRAAEGRAERIDQQADALADSVALLREAAERAERFLDPKRVRPASIGWYQREQEETLSALRRALAVTAPEEEHS